MNKYCKDALGLGTIVIVMGMIAILMLCFAK